MKSNGARSGSVTRRAAWGGAIGPVLFVGAWSSAAAVTARAYSPVYDAISRLAERGADTRVLMSAGFVGLGVALPIYARALHRAVPGVAWLAATTTGIATLAVAAFPLGHSASGDTWHGVFAGIGYVTLASTPLLAARPLLRQGHRALAALGVVAGAVSTVSLVLTTTAAQKGLFQRVGLTATDLWIAVSAVTIARA